MNRYTKPGKALAYEKAAALARALTDEGLADTPFATIMPMIISECPDLNLNDTQQVVARAIRVERGKRMQQTAKTQVITRLNDADHTKLLELAERYGGQSQAMRLAIRRFHRDVLAG